MFSTCVFDSMIASAFQITFRVKMHVNDVFYFLKIIFDINTSKRSKTYKPYLILIKKQKFLKFLGTQPQPQPRSQTYV